VSEERRFPPIGIILFCVAFALLVGGGLFWVLPLFSPVDDWVGSAAMIVTGFIAGLTLSGLWKMERWSIPYAAFFIVLMEAALFLIGPPEALVQVAVRTGIWLLLLAWAYGANKKHFV
jgi:hypothetical protein